MAHKDYFTNIMLDIECATAVLPNPVILELAAVYFDIDTGAELDHYSTIVSFASCEELGLKQDQSTMKWLNLHIPGTLDASMAGGKPLRDALSEFKDFVLKCCQATRERVKMHPQPYGFAQPMIWGNGAVADNVWIASAYRACNLKRPWEFYNDMCVRTFVKQAHIMTGRDFKKEAIFQGQEHVALNDCRHQVTYLVNARNALLSLSQPVVEAKPAILETLLAIADDETERVAKIVLPTPESSFSSADPDVEQDFISTATSSDEFEETMSEHEAFLVIISSSQEVPNEVFDEDPMMPLPIMRSSLLGPETSFSSADGDAALSPFDPPSIDQEALPVTPPPSSEPTNMKPQEDDEEESIMNAVLGGSSSAAPNGQRIRDAPYRVTKSAPNGNQRRRGGQVRTPKQLSTPENSFNAEDFEKEYELGTQQDQSVVGPQD